MMLCANLGITKQSATGSLISMTALMSIFKYLYNYKDGIIITLRPLNRSLMTEETVYISIWPVYPPFYSLWYALMYYFA